MPCLCLENNLAGALKNWPVQCKHYFFSLNVTSQMNAEISEFTGFGGSQII